MATSTAAVTLIATQKKKTDTTYVNPRRNPVQRAVQSRVVAQTTPWKDEAYTPYAKGTRTGLSTYQNASVTSTEKQLSQVPTRCPFAYVIADINNTNQVQVGDQGAEVLTMNPGDVFLFLDLAPSDVWCLAATGTQKVVYIGFGIPGA